MIDYTDEALSLDERVDALIQQMTIEEKVSQLTSSSAAVERLGIPEYDWWNEALHGVARAGKATVFPQAIGLAAMFDEKLLYEIAAVIAEEARAKYNEAVKNGLRDRYHGLTFWSPNVNIFRDPRWGRGHETYGEDPYLSARLGAAFIKGIQQRGEKHLKAAACAKHFAVHSGPESVRFGFNAKVSEKDLRETYLPAFEACVKEGEVEAVMGAYNAVNGVPVCCNKRLLTDILRGEWGFDGHVVSDCDAVCNIYKHHKYSESYAEAAALSIKAGCDLNCGNAYEKLTDAYESDLISENDLDCALRHTLKTRFKLGMFDGKTEFDSIPTSVIACEKHKSLSLKAAQESLVLLKNDGILPLDKNKIKTVAVLGPNADSKDVLLGNYFGMPTKYRTVYNGFCELLGEDNVRYAKGCRMFGGPSDELYNNAVGFARECDVTVLCLGYDGGVEGEGGDISDLSTDNRPSLELPGAQQDLLERVCAVSDKVIVIVFSGTGIALSFADENANAVLQGWYPGELGGLAAAQLILGEFSPSGRLPVTFYRSAADLPVIEDYSMKNRTYRYFEGEPLYPFGHGLSYTTFEYGEIQLKSDGAVVRASLIVKNTGSFDSEHTVLLYLTEKNRPENQPIKRLAGFKRIYLKQGEATEACFELSAADFTRVNENGTREQHNSDDFEIFVEKQQRLGV